MDNRLRYVHFEALFLGTDRHALVSNIIRIYCGTVSFANIKCRPRVRKFCQYSVVWHPDFFVNTFDKIVCLSTCVSRIYDYVVNVAVRSPFIQHNNNNNINNNSFMALM